MPCTTILVGKNASYNHSTMIARNDDSPTGTFTPKRLVIVNPKDQPRHYKSVLSGMKLELPDNPLRYSAFPNVNNKVGTWAAAGVNEENVAMTATETITSNSRVLGADPLLQCDYAGNKNKPSAGLGEEDIVVITLPYIHSAREGVLRLGKLIEENGTYESNGIAFSDKDEIWWLESIGGHHWIAHRVDDDSYITMPNQFGLDVFSFEDAYGEKKNNLCSNDLKEFVSKYSLDLTPNKPFNPRLAFGSHTDTDHIYNTPRAWYIERYLSASKAKWDGENATYSPLSDDIPWSNKADRLITVEDIKFLLSSHFQGTPYDPYAKYGDPSNKGAFRPIGISRTSFLSLAEIRPTKDKASSALIHFAFGSNVFNAFVPFYPNVTKVPSYFSKTTETADSENFYWASRLIGALADSHFNLTSQGIERYQNAVANLGTSIVNKTDAQIVSGNSLEEANAEIAKMVKEETDKALGKVLYDVSCLMKNGYAKSDN